MNKKRLRLMEIKALSQYDDLRGRLAQKRVLLFIPTYDECENVAPLWEVLKSLNFKWDVLFLDDNSPDGTGEVLDKIAESESNLKVIHRSGKQGIGSAHKIGIEYAYDKGYDLLLTMDADFTQTPGDIPRFLEQSESYAVVIGSRYLCKDSLRTWNLHRKSLTWLAHWLTTLFLGLKYDSTGAFPA